jgi:hypothetical protein
LLDTGKIGGVSVKEGKESNPVLKNFHTKAIMPQVQIFQCASLQFLRCESSGVHHFAQVPQALRRDEDSRIGFDRPYSLIFLIQEPARDRGSHLEL